MGLEGVTPHHARVVLGVVGLELFASYPSGFTRKLVETILAADPANRAKLALGFPEYAAAVEAYYENPAGFEHLKTLAAAR